MSHTDVLAATKTNLAPYLGADPDIIRRDAAAQRCARPTDFADLLRLQGVDDVADPVVANGGRVDRDETQAS